MHVIPTAIFFQVLANAAASVLWGVLAGAVMTGLVVAVLKGLRSRLEITPIGWLGLGLHFVIGIILMTIMAGTLKLNSSVTDVIQSLDSLHEADVPSWITTYLSGAGIYGDAALSQVKTALRELSSSLSATMWKMIAWEIFLSVAAIIAGNYFASKATRASAKQRSRRARETDDF